MMETQQATPETPTNKAAAREQLILAHLGLVKRIALQIVGGLPTSVHVDELICAGNEGLMHAVDRFEPSFGTTFAQFAKHRIRGAILDELRRLDCLSRADRR